MGSALQEASATTAHIEQSLAFLSTNDHRSSSSSIMDVGSSESGATNVGLDPEKMGAKLGRVDFHRKVKIHAKDTTHIYERI